MSSYMLETNSPWILIGFFLGEAEKRKFIGCTKVPTAAADIIMSLHHPFWIPPILNYKFCWVLTGSVIRLLSLRDLRSKLQSFFLYKFIYFFMVVLGLHCCAWVFPSCGEQGLFIYLFCGAWAFYCSAFLCYLSSVLMELKEAKKNIIKHKDFILFHSSCHIPPPHLLLTRRRNKKWEKIGSCLAISVLEPGFHTFPELKFTLQRLCVIPLHFMYKKYHFALPWTFKWFSSTF